MSAAGIIVCRLFSGPHLGAELVLPAGQQVIGADDSCDVILQDGSVASRHAVLDIAFDADGTASVRVTPLDGEVLLDERPLPPDGAIIPERTPFFLGLTSFAWAPPETSAEAWRQVATGLQEKRSSVEASPEKADVSPDAEEPLLLDELAEVSAGSPANDVGENGWRRLRRLPPRRMALLLLVLIALAGLTFSYEGRLPDHSIRVEEMRALIQKQGFDGIKVVPMGQGVGLSGMLEDDTDRAALLNLARSVHYPVYLDVKVRGDRVKAVASAFASRGFAVAVQEKADDPRGGLEIAGYMQDGAVEEQTFSSVREDIPALRAEAVWNTLKRTIRHAADVEAALLPRLREAGLSFVQVRCGRGKVQVAGTFDTEQRARLDALLDEVRENLGVPVIFEVAASFDKPRQTGRREVPEKLASAPQAEGPSAPADDLSSIRVTSVTLTPMRFISLGSGQRIFEGGQLPGGYVLESVGVKELKLRKDGRVILYPLRGPHE